ncbi:MAG: hypothetical protein M3405_14635 [Acidobacteriota bacterium]|jgi:Skp family chaperone for outer membrane proteins|nr:hypothetical protein [Acidobacteriota bacterium]
MKKYSFVFLMCLILTFPADAQQNITADLVIINANVRTMNAKQPTVRSISFFKVTKFDFIYKRDKRIGRKI